jgi:hypothetical protein
MGRVEKPALRRWNRARYLIIQAQRDGRAFLSHCFASVLHDACRSRSTIAALARVVIAATAIAPAERAAWLMRFAERGEQLNGSHRSAGRREHDGDEA